MSLWSLKHMSFSISMLYILIENLKECHKKYFLHFNSQAGKHFYFGVNRLVYCLDCFQDGFILPWKIKFAIRNFDIEGPINDRDRWLTSKFVEREHSHNLEHNSIIEDFCPPFLCFSLNGDEGRLILWNMWFNIF